MAVPTFVSYADSGNFTTASGATRTVAGVSVTSGDRIVVVGMVEEGSRTLGTPGDGGVNTYSLQQKPNADDDGSHCDVWLWTATAASSTSLTISCTWTGVSGVGGIGVLVFRDSDGFGNSAGNEASGTAPSLALTTTAANSAIVLMNADWNAADGTSRTWRTINSVTPTSGNGLEKLYARNASSATTYIGYWSDAGATGAKTTGLTAPTGQTGNTVVVEVKGTAAAASTTQILMMPARSA